MTDTSDKALDALVVELNDTSHGVRLSRKSAETITALRAENAALREKLATAERDAYARGVNDAAAWLNGQSLTDDELQQGITFKDNYPEYAATALIATLLPQAEGGAA